MSRLADGILSLHGWVAVLVVFVVPALEASAFVGFLFPGEIAVLLGGVLAFEHRVALGVVIAAAIAGAVVGDTVGYFVGRRWGRRLLHGTVGRVVRQHHLDRAERYLAERGGRAVFLGRFTAALRVLIPGLAGMAQVDYRTFAVWNLAGGALWATAFVLTGYVAGTGWRKAEHVARKAGIVLLLGVVVCVAIFLAGRWVACHQDKVRAFARRQLERPRVAAVRDRYRRQLDFLVARFRPQGAMGLSLTLSLAAIALAGWGLGVLVNEVVSPAARAPFDRPVLDWFVRHREPWVTTLMKAVGNMGEITVLAPLALVVGLLWRWRRRSWRPLAVLTGALGGAALLTVAVKTLVERARPPAGLALEHVSGHSFPSGHAAHSAALWGAVAALVAAQATTWSKKVVAWSGALAAVLATGGTRVYLGAHWPSDVAAGWALGAVWLFAFLLTLRMVDHRRARSGVRDPTSPGAVAVGTGRG